MSARVLVIGCPRSGTSYVAELLRRGGLDVGHEKVGRDATVGFPYAAGTKYVSDFDGFGAYEVLIHLVREPLACIASMQTLTRSSWIFFGSRMGIGLRPQAGSLLDCVIRTREQNLLAVAMDAWVQWNRLCEATSPCVTRFRIEDIDTPDGLAAFIAALPACHQSGFAPRGTDDGLDRTMNTRDHDGLLWPDLWARSKFLANEVTEMAVRYGYDVIYPIGDPRYVERTDEERRACGENRPGGEEDQGIALNQEDGAAQADAGAAAGRTGGAPGG